MFLLPFLAVIPASAGEASPLGAPRDGAAVGQLYRPGKHHGDATLPAQGSDVLALCGSALVAGPATRTLVKDEVIDEDDQMTGQLLGGPCEAVALFQGIPGLEAGPVTAVEGKLTRDAWTPFVVGDREVRLRTRAVGETGFTVEMDDEGIWDLVTHPETDEGSASLVWAGDLDGDGRLDLILNATPKYSVSVYMLYLSSAATKGPLGKVSELRVTSC